ncbi:DUF58 domain-containing protein [Undibacterium sp. FT137W]|uniref:DUF58 domain-containing protein n=2 Tax=Undibacterium fentianense TaxID=2828728 RepID=A0A941E832_9BURK|nr:DUF58 domain-containing protein [Undibacterium fentianense]
MIDTNYLLAHSQDLDLIIRHVLAGLGHGLHAGKERGAGVEFSEYRAYAPGDEWRRVDWKLLARNDRYYVREAERDSHVAIWFWLDASASMGEISYRYPEISKLDYARAVVACLAAVAQRQGDAFGLIVANQARIHLTPLSRGPRQLQRILAHLNRTKAEQQLPDAMQIKAQMQFIRAPSLLFAVSDFLDWPSASGESLLRLRRMRHDVRALSLHTEAERNASFPLHTSFRDPESSAYTSELTAQQRPAYQAAYVQHYERVRQDLKAMDIPYLQVNIEEDIAKVVRNWLRKAGRG